MSATRTNGGPEERTSDHGLPRRVLDPVAAALATMTDGQRWTSGLAIALAVAVLVFGVPDGGAGFADAAVPGGGSGSGGSAAPAAVTPPGGPGPGLGSAGGSSSRPGGAAAASTPPPTGATPPSDGPPASGRQPSVAALVAPPGPIELRSDAAMVGRLAALQGTRLDEVIVVGDPAATCAAVAGHDVVLAASPLPAPVRACLADTPALVVAHDDAGGDGRSDRTSGIVSSRRGVLASVVDTLGAAPSAFVGRTVVVAATRLQAAADAAAEALRQAGVDVVGVRVIPDDQVAGIAAATALAELRPDTVVLATAVADQVGLASVLGFLRPGVRYVVADAADVIVDETYPATFDGAVAVTATLPGWGDRGGAPDPGRSACLESWEQAQNPPSTVDDEERLRVLVWCGLLAIGRGVADASDGPAAASAVLATSWPALATTALGPLPDEQRWGPQAVTVLEWQAACVCWVPRSGGADG